MDSEALALTISYHGQELEMPVKPYPYGHTFRIDVQAGEQLITFEPDEEGSFRAFANNMVDKNLIAAIAAELEKLR